MATPAEVPGEIPGKSVAILALMMFLAPVLGAPIDEMLQDTLKSIVVSFAALGAGIVFFGREIRQRDALRWHAGAWLPLLLMAYAVGSMAWSHTYLAAVESIRWFIFSLLLWLGLNTLSRERLPLLALGVHAGAVVASLWAVLQFSASFGFFPQGPKPASTFINRNFFAEFAVCTLPFGAVLLARARVRAEAVLVAASAGLVVTAILMTGTRSALVSLWLQLGLLLPFLAWRYRRHFRFAGWSRGMQALVVCTFLGTVLVLGAIPTSDADIAQEGRGLTGLERGLKRTASFSTTDPSLAVRRNIWRATLRVIADRPLTGVGAGAWENEIPLYQDAQDQLEHDYYVHNEYLQLLAEYGLVGWAFLLALAAWLIAAAGRTLSPRGEAAQAEAPWRAVLLCSLFSLLLVSNLGFPWRMAATGALFALCLGGLAASDARLGMGIAPTWKVRGVRWQPGWSQAATFFVAAGMILAAFISWQAARAEYKIVRATLIARSITATGDFNNPRFRPMKAEMLTLIRDGIAINPHYRKITPIVADELARWADWKNAIWIWESVLPSRPNVVVMLANVARGYIYVGNTVKAMAYLDRARKIRPAAPAVRYLEILLLSSAGHEDKALALGRQSIGEQIVDYDIASLTFLLAGKAGDYELAQRAMSLRMAQYPESRALGYLQLGTMYHEALADADQALGAFRQALDSATSNPERDAVIARIPPAYAARLGLAPAPAEPPVTRPRARGGAASR